MRYRSRTRLPGLISSAACNPSCAIITRGPKMKALAIRSGSVRTRPVIRNIA